MSALVLKNTNLATIEQIIEQAKDYAHASKASATRRAYASDLRHFAAFCASINQSAFPATPQTVALYITTLAEKYAVATIKRRAVAIARQHKEYGAATAAYGEKIVNPVADEHVKAVLSGIVHTKGSQQNKKDALTSDPPWKLLIRSLKSNMQPVDY